MRAAGCGWGKLRRGPGAGGRGLPENRRGAPPAGRWAGGSVRPVPAGGGCPPNWPTRHFRRLKLTPVRHLQQGKPTPRRRNNDAHAAAAIEAYARGKLWREIAAELGVPRSTVRGRVKAYEGRHCSAYPPT